MKNLSWNKEGTVGIISIPQKEQMEKIEPLDLFKL